jgi:glutathione S-transferase
MKLYNGMSPSGLRVSVFLAEKGLDIPTTSINVLEGEARTPEFLAINSLGEVPVLELDDGQIITESLAICRYFEILHPEPSLMGQSAAEQAHIEMWSRRIELQILSVVGSIGLHEMPLFADKIQQFPNYAASQRRVFPKKLAWLDKEMSDGRSFVAGNDFTVADITGMAAMMICSFFEIEIPENLTYVKQWQESVMQRPSWPAMPD